MALTMWRMRAIRRTPICCNRLRHHVIPRLLSENPALLRSYAAASERMRQEDAFLNQQASEALARARQGAAIQCSALLAEPPVLQARAILLWLRQLQIPTPSASHVQALVQLLKSPNPSAQVTLPGNLIISRQYDCLVQCPPTGSGDCTNFSESPWYHTGSGAWHPGFVQLYSVGWRRRPSRHRATFLRSRQAGDTLRLPGGPEITEKMDD